MERKKLAPGVFITILDAEKFNRCRITIHLRYPALRRSATDAAVLPLVLERGYAGCPDMTELSRKLARLYGADLGVDQSSAGIDRVLTVDICGIKDRFALDGENLTREYADIAFGTIFEPYLIDGVFDPEAVRIEKESLARRLDAERFQPAADIPGDTVEREPAAADAAAGRVLIRLAQRPGQPAVQHIAGGVVDDQRRDAAPLTLPCGPDALRVHPGLDDRKVDALCPEVVCIGKRL